MTFLPPRFILFDTEYTAWEGSMARGWSNPGEYRELVQIGAVRVENQTLAELDAFTIFAKPEKNPALSDFFITLTGITQEDVDRQGVRFPEAIQKFVVWTDDDPLFSWGGDAAILEENSGFHGLPNPFPPNRCADIRPLFRDAGIPTTGYASSTIVRAFGTEPARRAHNALNDARQILDALRLLRARPTRHR